MDNARSVLRRVPETAGRLDALMRSTDRVVYTLSSLGGICGAVVLAGLMVAVSVSAIARTVFDVSLFDVITPSRIAMSFMVFVGLAWAMRTEQHVRVGLLRGVLPPRWRTAIRAATMSLALGTLLVVVWQTAEFAYAAYRLDEQIIGDITWPAFPFQLVVPIGLALLALESVRDIFRDIVASVTGTLAADIEAAEEGGEWK